PAKGSATVLLDRDRLRAVDRIVLDGDGLSLRGSATATNGKIAGVRLDRAVFGRSDLRGEVRLPAGGPIGLELSGASLDLGAKLAAKTPKSDKPKGEPPPGPAWTLDARFDRVLLANDQVATGLVAQAENDGRIMRRLHAEGRVAADAPFQLDIAPEGNGRRLAATAADAGALLGGLDVLRSMAGGTMALRGNYDDRTSAHLLTGTAEIDGFRIHGLPALGKLLQAMTLYGLVDVLRGPGIGFTKMIAPFKYGEDVLTLNDARAFSASIGLTAKGRVDIAANQVDMEGTIVPAYFFNSLLGNIPLIGKLFSPEKGGGVFAASYGLHGKLDDPAVSVNPLSALTPGFLREIFGIF
ncbi:MAG: AsmA-like C-terminal domain-containing protein, partial [Rhodospirillales bacterium]|nr:AsmA-like C-terminal domain-containing protein [Rhodospirillales bacterium]